MSHPWSSCPAPSSTPPSPPQVSAGGGGCAPPVPSPAPVLLPSTHPVPEHWDISCVCPPSTLGLSLAAGAGRVHPGCAPQAALAPPSPPELWGVSSLFPWRGGHTHNLVPSPMGWRAGRQDRTPPSAGGGGDLGADGDRLGATGRPPVSPLPPPLHPMRTVPTPPPQRDPGGGVVGTKGLSIPPHPSMVGVVVASPQGGGLAGRGGGHGPSPAQSHF